MTISLPSYVVESVSEAISPLAAEILAQNGACLPGDGLGSDALLQWMPDCDALALFSSFGNSEFVSNGERAREVIEAPLLQPVFSGFQPVIDDEERKLLWGVMLVGRLVSAESLKLSIARLREARRHGEFSFMGAPDPAPDGEGLMIRTAQALPPPTVAQIRKFAESLGWDSQEEIRSVSEIVISTDGGQQILFDYEPRVPQLWMLGSLGAMPSSDSQWLSLLRMPFENGNLVGFQLVCDPFDEELKLACPIPAANFEAEQAMQLLARFADMLSTPLFGDAEPLQVGLRI